jgi:two-component system, OmpR family, sensor histidine kinase QseC
VKSLRARLLVSIGASLLVLWALVAVWMFAGVRAQLRSALDDRLAASARMAAVLVSQLPAPAVLSQEGSSHLLDVIGRDGVACEVSLMRGEVSVRTLARTAGSPGLAAAVPGYGTRTFGGKQWRVYVLDTGSLRIATADRLDVRASLLREAALAAALPFAVALAGSLAILWFAIGSSLAPLERVRQILQRRRAHDDEPLPRMPVPRELEPLVDTIGELLQRVRAALERERRFTDDAAHELRTPLTAIKTHLQVLQLAAPSASMTREGADALRHAGEGVLRMQRTLEQLLLLARLDGQLEEHEGDRCEALAAARHAAREAELGSHGHGRVRIDDASGGIAVAVPEALLVSALRNLLENALRAAPEGSVMLRIESAADRVFCSVIDEGPGMSEEECERAVDRFWRRGQRGQGSGLGLAIVHSVAQRFGGSLTLRPRAGAHGLEARLLFPQPDAGGPATDGPVTDGPS